MRLDKLQIDLRPRPNAQALELGLALLRANAATVYKAWLALWLPLMLLTAALAWLFPDGATWWLLLPWWLRPLLERAPLYILARRVFGEEVTWQGALRAWPRQLGGGWFRLLTWWRPFMPGRGLFQPIWQLEGARGREAAQRRRVIGAAGTAGSAYWYGIVCAHLEAVIQIGTVAFIGIFLADEGAINPFKFLFSFGEKQETMLTVVTYICYALCGGIIGPVYAAGCFTLYLNRRATLEAWDIEIALRQLKPASPQERAGALVPGAKAALALLACVLLVAMQPQTARAAVEACKEPEWSLTLGNERAPARNETQKRLREEVDQLYRDDDLRNYRCEETWVRKPKPNEKKKEEKEKEEKKKNSPPPDMEAYAAVVRLLLITLAIVGVVWLLYRFRGNFSTLFGQRNPELATEIGGLDIRPESLPDDVSSNVLALWRKDEHRAALALLYRATVSRLINENGLLLTRGATEADCLRLANRAARMQRLDAGRLRVATAVTSVWLDGAYGNRWPQDEKVEALCQDWRVSFDGGARTSVEAA